MELLPITRNFLTCKITRPALKDPAKYALRKVGAIVAHYTGNPGHGANAQANRSYFNQGFRAASAHYCVDDHSIVQCLPDREVGYHVGDRPLGVYKSAGLLLMGGAHGLTPNYFCIGVEMCINSDGDWNKTRWHSAALYAYLLSKHNLPISQLLRHFDITGKKCPAMFLADRLWEDYKGEIAVILQGYAGALRGIVNAKGLNVRTGPGANFPVVTELKMGEPVIVFEQAGDWSRVEPGGWVNARYLTVTQPYGMASVAMPA